MNNLISYMVNNKIASQLLMIVVFIAGILSFIDLHKTVFPESQLDIINVEVEYPGATPQEIEKSIIKRIEEAVRSIQEIKEVNATAVANKAIINIELKRGTDKVKKQHDIEAAIDRLKSFPKDAEKPYVNAADGKAKLIEIIFYGNANAKVLKELSKKVKDELVLKTDVSSTKIKGAKDYEINIAFDQNKLQAHGLTINEVANIVQSNSLDLPSGEIKTKHNNLYIHVKGQNYHRKEYHNIVVSSARNGANVHLGDIATISDGFKDNALKLLFNNQPAVSLKIFNTDSDNIIKITKQIKHYLQHDLKLPPNIHYHLWADTSDSLKSRLSLLLENGIEGIILVVVLLSLLLNFRLAMWVSFGIIFSFIGTFFIMRIAGININQISLFGFILAIGIVVDDAIVISENIYAKYEQGLDGIKAAISGTCEVASPVIFSVLTTIIAFSPLLFVPGVLGKFMSDVPRIVIIILTLSLIESLFVLPSHLSHLTIGKTYSSGLLGRYATLQKTIMNGLNAFTQGPLDRLVRVILRYPYVFLLGYFLVIFLSISLVKLGHVKVAFFPDVPGRYVTATIDLASGASVERTQQTLDQIKQGSVSAAKQLANDFNIPVDSVILNTYTSIGQHNYVKKPPTANNQDEQVNANTATMIIQLSRADQRPFSTEKFEMLWRRATGSVSDIKKLTFNSASIKIGEPIHIELSADSGLVLENATDQLRNILSGFQGVTEIRDTRDNDNQELHIRLKPKAISYGLNLKDVAYQLRHAFHGSEIQRLIRGTDEVQVFVRFDRGDRNSIDDLNSLQIKTKDGDFIPLPQIATVSVINSPAIIQRHNRKRIINVFANVQPGVGNAEDINKVLRNKLLPKLKQSNYGLEYSFGGEQKRKAEILPFLKTNLLIAMCLMYGLMALIFRSYLQPLFVLAIIPLAVVGAILGHLMLGLSLGFLSFFGIVGLSGIIVNNGIILIDAYNENKNKYANLDEAIVESVKQRFRPMFITSFTTFLGIMPLILETSEQAQYLKPMAVTIGFGVLIGSVLFIMILPAILGLKAHKGS